MNDLTTIPQFYHTEHETLSTLEEQECKQAIESQDARKLKELFLKNLLPLNLETPFAIITLMQKNTTKTCTEILLENNNGSGDATCFDVADAILTKGARLPTPYYGRETFETTSAYFTHLATCCYDLYIALRINPDIIKEQDEEQKTLLHHSASIGYNVGQNRAVLIFNLLLAAPGIDFTAKDIHGSTPLKIAESYALQEKVTSSYIYPLLAKKTEEAHK